jgi:hypothetical protein
MTNKERTNKERTNKQRTNKERTNKERTNKEQTNNAPDQVRPGKDGTVRASRRCASHFLEKNFLKTKPGTFKYLYKIFCIQTV